MDKLEFEKYYRTILKKASDKRRAKEAEYFSEDDLLSSFRKIARFRNKQTPAMIMDLVAKQLQSLSDMVDAEFPPDGITSTDPPATLSLWEEKFIDSLNYLFKLYSAIREERGI